MQTNVLAYLLQGIVFPFSSGLAPVLADVPVVELIALFAFIWLLLTLGVWRWHGWRLALFGALWIIAGCGPSLIGLSWSYVRTGSRLLYPAAPGIALLWGSWLAQSVTARRVWARLLTSLMAAIVAFVSIGQWTHYNQLYQMGTHYLNQTIDVLAARPDQHLLFVNYPDRIELKAPYPLGNWGLVLAPVVQNLSDYALAKVGKSAIDESLSAFRVGADQRGAWRYAVNLRGEDTDPVRLAEAAAKADRVYVTDYVAEGQLALREVGAIRSATSPSSYLASIGDEAQLVSGLVSTDDEVVITLTWRSLRLLHKGDTIFVHLWRDGAFVSAHDGDSLGGLIPPSVWQPGSEVSDVRYIPRDELGPGQYEIRVGMYNRFDGVRYSAFSQAGSRVPDDEVAVGTFDIPAKQ